MSFSERNVLKRKQKKVVKKRPILIVGAVFVILFTALFFLQAGVTDEVNLLPEMEDSGFAQAEKNLLEGLQKTQGANSAQLKEAKQLLNNAFGDGKITVSTQRKEEPLTNCIEDYLEAEKGKGESVLLYQGYLGLFGNSWGCLLKDSNGVTLSVFSEKENVTVQDDYRLLQEVWNDAA